MKFLIPEWSEMIKFWRIFFSWANDILSRIRQASNSDAYLSILLILLSSFGGPCRQVKRKMWLNLATFASSPDHILRLKAATILSAASTKDQFVDLYNEMLLLLDQISPMLLSKNVEKPEERTLETLNTSLLIFNQSFVENEEELEESAEILERINFLYIPWLSPFNWSTDLGSHMLRLNRIRFI